MKRTFLIIMSLIMLFGASACHNTINIESAVVTQTVAALSPSATQEPTAQPTETSAATPIPTTTSEPAATPKYSFIGRVVCTANDYVNIRRQPSADSDIIGRFTAGTEADIIENSSDWVHIYYDDIEGYVHMDYTIASSSPSVEVPSGEWSAILVNPTHLLPDDYTVELSDFEGGQINALILEIATAMFEDAAGDGIDFTLVDAYRSYKTQEEYYEAKVKTYIDKGYSRADAEAKAATITARPNTSEHQTGLALDIVTPSYTKRNSGYADTQAFKWLYANAYKYGFIMRYPKGKEDITKVIFEPWHWRFVGVKAAEEIKKSGQCYEEYLGIID